MNSFKTLSLNILRNSLSIHSMKVIFSLVEGLKNNYGLCVRYHVIILSFIRIFTNEKRPHSLKERDLFL